MEIYSSHLELLLKIISLENEPHVVSTYFWTSNIEAPNSSRKTEPNS